MRPYICLIEVIWQPKPGRWNVEERSSRGTVALIGQYRWFWQAYRVAHRHAIRLKREQGSNLRLELHAFDKDNKRVTRVEYGRDPRSVR